VFAHVGFKEKGLYYINEKLKLDDDSASYYHSLAQIEDCYSNFEKAIEFGERAYAIDSTSSELMVILGISHMCLGHFKESLEYFKKQENLNKAQDKPSSLNFFRIGYAYRVNGFKEKGEYILNTGLEQYYELIELGRIQTFDRVKYYRFAAIYAILGDQEKAFENLRLFSQCSAMPLFMVKRCKNEPYFDQFRDEAEFQQIVHDVEAKYQAGHERIRKWLDENDML
jgi:tetratricopeptide (TPR) repeat protein